MMRNYCRVVVSQRMMIILCLGFSSGLPFPLISGTLSAWYTTAGVSLLSIGILSLVQLPYLFKPLWAPILDRFSPFRLGRRRSWLLLSQLCIAVSLFLMSTFSPQHHPQLLAYMAFMVAFFSASQDIAYDAYRTDLLSVKERGLGSAMVSVGYRVAILVSGSLALVMASVWGWYWVYLLMAILMLTQVVVSWLSPVIDKDIAPSNFRQAVIMPFSVFFKQNHALWILIFIILYKLADAFALSLSTTFLIRGIGFSLADIGVAMKLSAMSASLLGALIGGIWMIRLSHYQALFIFGVLQALSNVGYLLLVIFGHVMALMIAAVFIEYFCGGLASVAFVAYLMSLCHQRYTATQYALFSALASVGRVLIGPLAAWVAQHWGWLDYFSISILLGFPVLLLLWWMNHGLGLFEVDPKLHTLPRVN